MSCYTPCTTLGPCCGNLGVRYSIQWLQPNRRVRGTCDFAFTYWDFNCVRCFALPVYVNAPLDWAGTVVLSGKLTWTVTQVPYNSIAYMQMVDTSSCGGGQALLPIGIPASSCSRPVEDVVWEIMASGGTCLQFRWTANAAYFPGGYEYDLVDRNGFVIRVGVLDPEISEILFEDLPWDSSYAFTISGICGVTGAGIPTTVPASTLPAASLGPVVSIVSCVPVDGSDPLTCTIVIEYIDTYCVKDLELSSASVNPEAPDVALSTTMIEDQWEITNVPYSTEDQTYDLILVFSAVADGETYTCVAPYPGFPLLRTLALQVPFAPPESCPATSVIEPAAANPTGATCALVTWTVGRPYPFTYGLAYVITNTTSGSSQPPITGTVLYPGASLAVSGLLPANTYSVELTGQCGAESSSEAPVTLGFTTSDECLPSLPNYTGTPTFVTASDGTYTAAISYSGSDCVLPPTLRFAPNYRPPSQNMNIIASNDGVSWTVVGIPPSTTVPMYFSALVPAATGCTDCCVVDVVDTTTLTTSQFTFTTPPPSQLCSKKPIYLQFVPSLSGSTCLYFTWLPDTFTAYQWKLLDVDENIVQAGTLPGSAIFLNITGLEPSTVSSTFYLFKIKGVCGAFSGTEVYLEAETTAVTPPFLSEFDQSATNTIFSQTAGAVTYTVSITYPAWTCVTQPVLSWETTDYTPPVGAVIVQAVNGSNVWHITGVPVETAAYNLELTMSATGLAGTCINGCSGALTVLTQPVIIEVPVAPTPPPPTQQPPFYLTITHYGGPPQRIKIAGQTVTSTTIETMGDGDVTSPGSWKNQDYLNTVYANNVIEGFIKYNSQRKFAIGDYPPFYLPISAVFYGDALDPTVQGMSKPQPNGTGGFKAYLGYNLADSSSTINNPSVDPYSNFQFPPYLVFYKKMMIYNWEIQNGLYDHANSLPIQLGSNNYGSKAKYEQWWFNCIIDTNGEIKTIDPTDPKTKVSIVDSTTNDGNVNTFGNDPSAGLAGWNCMERWFMHAAYCNQQLRKYIAGGLITCTTESGPLTMTLEDLNNDNAKYYQISSITTDGEGDGFGNTLYGSCPEPFTNCPWAGHVTAAQCNYTMKALWNKWINQTTILPEPILAPTDIDGYTWTVPKAEYPRQDGRTFFLPCSFSMTTPGLLPDMTVGEVGSEDYDAVSGIFNEIYDTSGDQQAWANCLGASESLGLKCPVPKLGSSVSSTAIPAVLATVKGSPFTAQMYQDAFPTTSTDTFGSYPEKYAAQKGYGPWDNLIPPSLQCKGALAIVGNTLVPDPSPAKTGVLTSYNDSTCFVSPVMNTSAFSAWTNTSYPWIVSQSTTGIFDSNGLGWALEGSRYDMYNGLWAAGVAAQSGSGVIDYTKVVQGALLRDGSTVDGATIWKDLSTGMKPRVATRMKDITTVAAAKGQVWMLSNQCGPWVNCMGVRASARGNGPTTDVADFLTYTCPNNALGTDVQWPGWTNMRGQWWGPGTSATAGVLQQWSLDQASLGPLDPDKGQVVGTNSTENNFGVFQDFNIQVAAWLQMALDLQGLGTCSTGISASSGVQYKSTGPNVTGPPNIGCYELGFIPISWLGPLPPLPVLPDVE